jgi:NAD(P)-dependent dehydrogenase (short-subunit alcohol dehydrogenase family)
VVINTGSSRAQADAVAAEIEAASGHPLVHLANVTDEAAVQTVVDAALERFGRARHPDQQCRRPAAGPAHRDREESSAMSADSAGATWPGLSCIS